MFNKEFFPTPPELAAEMLSGVDLNNKVVLDPSAGKGDLLKACERARHQCGSPAQMLAVEIEPELQAILRDIKGVRVIGDDWMTYSGNIWIDVVLMNPPFSAACQHVRKAWEVLRSGELIAIIPATMIWNPTQAESELLQELREAGATFDHAGNPFITAERKTGVEVFILRVKKQRENLFSFGNLRTGTSTDGFTFKEQEAGQVMRADMLARLTDTFQAALNGFADVLRATNTLVSILEVLPPDKRWHKFIAKELSNGTGSANFNGFAFELQGFVWDALFNKTHITSMVTSKVREEFEQMRQKAGGIDLTPENIQAVFSMLLDNREAMLQDSLEQAFDRMTKYYAGNRVSIKGYRTNDAWMVKDKVIIPYMVDVKAFGSYLSMNINYSKVDWCQDVDKALCLLSGVKYEEISDCERDEYGYALRHTSATIYDALGRACESYTTGRGGEDESYFFRVKVFKAGTAHLYWKDKELLNQFNAAVCRTKNWLPGDYGKSYRRKDNPTDIK